MNQKGLSLIELLVTIFIVLIFVAWIWSWFSLIKDCSGIANEIQKQGLQSVIERIWEGEEE